MDPFVRKGYRFKGPAAVHERGSPVCEEALERMRAQGSSLVDRVRAIVLVEVVEARAIVSPAYDGGEIGEAEMGEQKRKLATDFTDLKNARARL